MSTNKLSPFSWMLIIGVVAYWAFVLSDAGGPPPIAGDGLRVLIVEDAAKRGTLPLAQRTILSSPRVWDYLNTHCAKGADGEPARRIFDHEERMDDAEPEWQEAMKRPRKSLPWWVISNGKSGGEGPLPATEEEALAILKKWGGE